MSNLLSFIRARLDEDEAAASEAVPGPWVTRDDRGPLAESCVFGQSDWAGHLTHVAQTELNGKFWRENRDHIALHDPARVLREVEAKRRIIALHEREWDRHESGPEHVRYARSSACLSDVLRLLASPYADHPDYDESWRP